jgi:hypothetical protein
VHVVLEDDPSGGGDRSGQTPVRQRRYRDVPGSKSAHVLDCPI